MELLKVWTALLRRKWLFAQAVVFFIVGAGALAMLLPKRFEATSKISVDSSDALGSIMGELDLGEIASTLNGSSDDMQTMIALATMRPVLEETVWRLQLRDLDGELLPPEKLLVPGVDGELMAMPFVEISQSQGTNILLIKATADSAEKSALLADTIVEVYLQKSTDSAKKDIRDALGFVTTQLDTLRGKYDQELADLAIAQREEGVVDLDSEQKAAVSRINTLFEEMVIAKAGLADADAAVRERGAWNARESVDSISPGSTATNPKLKELQARQLELRNRRTQELLDKTDKHPDVIALDTELAGVISEIGKAVQEQHSLDPAVEADSVKRASYRSRIGQIQAEMQRTIDEGSNLPEKARRLAQRQLAATATETIYQSLLEQQYQIGIAEAMTVSSMKFVEPAKAPDKAAAPKLLVYLVLGAFVGMGVGVGLVFLAEYVDDSIRSKDDLRLAWPVAVLGMVPNYKPRPAARFIDSLPATDPLFESYRGIRSSIAFAGVDSPITILTVTSCAPGEGKSTFCTNLAICLASDGQKVVIVDCDLRRPTQHRAFPTLSNQRGVSSVLTGNCTLAEAIQEGPVPNLHFLTSGPLPTNPGRLVESLRLRSLVTELARSYDMVIIDAPPLLAVADAIPLSRASRATLVVVEHGKTTRRMVTDLRHRMESGGVEPIGVVLNKVDPKAGSYGTYQKYARLYAKRPTEVPPIRAGGEAS